MHFSHDSTWTLEYLHTDTKPVPSPVKKSPPGPTWIEQTACLAKILPLSAKLKQWKPKLLSIMEASQNHQKENRITNTKRLAGGADTHDGRSYNRTVLSSHEDSSIGLFVESCITHMERLPCKEDAIFQKLELFLNKSHR